MEMYSSSQYPRPAVRRRRSGARAAERVVGRLP